MREKVLAVVAGHEITEGELNTLLSNYPPQEQVYMSNPKAKEQLLDQLIAFHLFAKMAEEEKITETEEYQTMIEKMKVELASHMAATKTVESLTVTAEEEQAFYEENQEQFVQEGKVRAKHILVGTEELAKQVAEEIENGKTFEDAAKEYSTCPSNEKGGDLGFFSKGQMVPEFEKAAFEGELNVVIGPVQTQFGFHLIQVEEKTEKKVVPFTQVQSQIHQHIIQNKQKDAYDWKVAELTKKYGVEKKI